MGIQATRLHLGMLQSMVLMVSIRDHESKEASFLLLSLAQQNMEQLLEARAHPVLLGVSPKLELAAVQSLIASPLHKPQHKIT